VEGLQVYQLRIHVLALRGHDHCHLYSGDTTRHWLSAWYIFIYQNTIHVVTLLYKWNTLEAGKQIKIISTSYIYASSDTQGWFRSLHRPLGRLARKALNLQPKIDMKCCSVRSNQITAPISNLFSLVILLIRKWGWNQWNDSIRSAVKSKEILLIVPGVNVASAIRGGIRGWYLCYYDNKQFMMKFATNYLLLHKTFNSDAQFNMHVHKHTIYRTQHANVGESSFCP